MNIVRMEIEGVFVIEPQVYGDARGYFFESFNAYEFAQKTGLDVRFVQDNESRSHYGVIRGLHFQQPPHAQAKLVRVVDGRVLDVGVDLRKDSPTYGRHVAVELSSDNKRQLFLPKGFAHGFAVLSDFATFQYKCDAYYHPEAEGALAWDDATLSIDWKIPPDKVSLSDKDRHNPAFSSFITPF